MKRAVPIDAIPARTAYRLWAPGYDRETVISALDERAVSEVSPHPAGRHLLDAGCGTGRRLRGAAQNAASAMGVDLVPEMLLVGREMAPIRAPLVAADLTALPLQDDSFDLVWCRLVAGHVADLPSLHSELGRVCRPGGRLVLTDFHPSAAAAGHGRTFRDREGVIHRVLHHTHTEGDHERAAGVAGWRIVAVRHLSPGPEERGFYRQAGLEDRYRDHQHLPLVLAVCMER